jgi:hypothetical protein
MQNVIERIAGHADIDTRRAMGFGPRKIVLPDLNLPFKIEESGTTNWCKYIELPNAVLYIYSRNTQIVWVFGSHRRYYALNGDGLVTRRNSGQEHFDYSRHPDINDDGSLKRSRPTTDSDQ